jgi:hypothetical protein
MRKDHRITSAAPTNSKLFDDGRNAEVNQLEHSYKNQLLSLGITQREGQNGGCTINRLQHDVKPLSLKARIAAHRSHARSTNVRGKYPRIALQSKSWNRYTTRALKTTTIVNLEPPLADWTHWLLVSTPTM